MPHVYSKSSQGPVFKGGSLMVPDLAFEPLLLPVQDSLMQHSQMLCISVYQEHIQLFTETVML